MEGKGKERWGWYLNGDVGQGRLFCLCVCLFIYCQGFDWLHPTGKAGFRSCFCVCTHDLKIHEIIDYTNFLWRSEEMKFNAIWFHLLDPLLTFSLVHMTPGLTSQYWMGHQVFYLQDYKLLIAWLHTQIFVALKRNMTLSKRYMLPI